MDIEEYLPMSQEELISLNSSSGTLLLLDVPDGLQFGIDNIVWKIGSKFKGIKFVPFGAHIISYSLQEENHQFKINKFLIFDQSKGFQTQILILKWSFKYSMFLELKGSEGQGYREGVKNNHFDSYLGPYPLKNLQFWRENSNHITRMVLQKLEPIEKIYKFQEEYEKIKEKKQEQVRVDVDQDDEEEIIQHEEDQEQENQTKNTQMDSKSTLLKEEVINQTKQGMNKKFEALSDTIYYSQIPRILTNDPTHINKVNLNKTELLIEVILKQYLSQNQASNKPKETHIFGILGEIQYAFIYFLIGQDLESLEQWKKLINLLVFSEDLFESSQSIEFKKQELSRGNSLAIHLINSFEKLSLEFIVILYSQIRQFPADFFIDELSKNSFMENCLKRLHEYKEESEGIISKKVKKRLEKLFKLLSTKFNYEPKIQNQQDYDEDAPVVVQSGETYF